MCVHTRLLLACRSQCVCDGQEEPCAQQRGGCLHTGLLCVHGCGWCAGCWASRGMQKWCMWVCGCMCTQVWARMHMQVRVVCKHARVCSCMQAYMCLTCMSTVLAGMCACMCTGVCMYVAACMCMCRYMYACVCACMCVQATGGHAVLLCVCLHALTNGSETSIVPGRGGCSESDASPPTPPPQPQAPRDPGSVLWDGPQPPAAMGLFTALTSHH